VLLLFNFVVTEGEFGSVAAMAKMGAKYQFEERMRLSEPKQKRIKDVAIKEESKYIFEKIV
jgi:hypothetical protein